MKKLLALLERFRSGTRITREKRQGKKPMGKRAKRAVAAAVAVVLVLSLLPLTPLSPFSPMEAAADEYSVFDLLGIDTTSKPDGYVEGDDVNPYGREKINVNPVSELYIEANTVTGRDGTLYGDGTNPTGEGFYAGADEYVGVDSADYDVAQAAVGDFTNSGLKDKAVVVGANVSGGLYLYFMDPADGTTSDDVKTLISAGTKIYNSKEAETWFDEDAEYTVAKDDASADRNLVVPLYSPQVLNNYLGVVTGDFTGDGIDEIAVYVPDPADPRVEIYQLQLPQSGGAWNDLTKWQRIFTYALERYEHNDEYFVPNNVSMVTGDIDFDGIDDLAVSAGAYTTEPYDGTNDSFKDNSVTPFYRLVDGFSQNAKVNVLFGAKDGSQLTRKLPVASTATPYISLAFGDADKNGRDELVLCDVKFGDAPHSFAFYQLVTGTQYNPQISGFTQIYSTQFNAAVTASGYYGTTPTLIRSNAMVVRAGAGSSYISWTSRVFRVTGTEVPTVTTNDSDRMPEPEAIDYEGIADIDQTPTAVDRWADTSGSPYFATFGEVAADLNGDGSDEIIAYYSKNTPVYEKTGTTALKNTNHFFYFGTAAERSVRIYSAEKSGNSADMTDTFPQSSSSGGILFAAPDIDGDTTLIEFKERRFAYSDPKLLAVLAAPPVFTELAYLPGGDAYMGSETTYASSAGKEDSESTATTFSLGAYIGFEYEFEPLGIVEGFSIETELEYMHDWTWTSETSKSITYTVEYGTQSGNDSVALYCVPTDIYVYEATSTDELGNKISTEMTIVQPYSPVVKIISVEEYDDVAAAFSGLLPKVRGNLLTNAQGDPSTYPKDTSGMNMPLVFDGSYAGSGFGAGSIKQVIEVETTSTEATTNTDSVSFKAGGGAGGVSIGVILGGSWERTDVHTSIAGDEFSGTLFNMPNEAKNLGYNYAWKLVQYWHETPDPASSGKKLRIPVVTYLVKDVVRPPKPPQNLDVDVESTTADTIRLTWEYAGNVSGFYVYRQDKTPGAGGNFLEIGYVPYMVGETEYSFEDTGLAAATEYTYTVQVKRSAMPQLSVRAEPVSAWTTVAVGLPTVNLDTYELTAYPDRTYTVKSSLADVAPGAGAASYAWQKYTNGKWDLLGVNTQNLSITAPKPATAGLYRLRVTQTVANQTAVAYSPSLEIAFLKRTASLALAATDQPVFTAELANTAPDSIAVPSGSVTFNVRYSADGIAWTESEQSVPIAGGRASFTPQADGLYVISAYYPGDSVFDGVESEPLTRYKTNDTNKVSYYIAAPDEVTHEEVFEFSVVKVEKNGNQTTVTELPRTGDGAEYAVITPDAHVGKIYSLADQYDPASPTRRVGYAKIISGETDAFIMCDVYSSEVTKLESLIKKITVKPRAITVTAPSATVQNADLAPVTTAGLTVSGESSYVSDSGGTYTFPFTKGSYIEIAHLNNAGGAVTFSASTSPGIYTVSPKIINAPLANGYLVTCVSGDYTVTSKSYVLTGAAKPLNEKAVGSLALTAPAFIDFTDSQPVRYIYGAGLTFKAAADTGYIVDYWKFGIEEIQGDEMPDRTTLTRTMPGSDTTVAVYFRELTQPLTYRNIGDGAVSVDPASQSGDQVKVGTPLAFTATADTGNAFKEWMVKTGTDQYSYSAGGVDGDGKPILQMNMPDAALEVVARFEGNPRVSWSAEGDGAVALVGYDDVDTALVAAGTELKFAAMPDAGNVFKEWRVKRGTEPYEYPVGTSITADEGGGILSLLAMTMPDAALEVVAVFEDATPTVTGVTVSPDAAAVGQGGQFQFSAAVEGTYLPTPNAVEWSVSGSSNASTTISAAGLLSVALYEAEVTLTVRATSVYDNSEFDEAAVTVTAEPPAGTAPTITTVSLPNGQVGTAYSYSLAATGTAPITWAVDDTQGPLPDGLSLSEAGVISGTPTASGDFAFTAIAANGADPNATKSLSIKVVAADPKTVSVGAQTGALTAGTAGIASYAVTTGNIADGAAIVLNNTNGAAGVSLDGGTAVTTGGSTAIAINTTEQTPAGVHPLTLTIDGVTSESFDLAVGSAPDTSKPTVTGVTPSGEGAALSGFIVIAFSEEMDPQTAGTVSVAGGEGVLASGEWASGGEYRILYIGFAPGTAYRIAISGFKDISGNAMDDDGNYSFTTRAEAPTDILVVSIEITGPTSIGTDGGTAQLAAAVTPADATNRALLWSVSDGGEYAALSLSGFVTAKGNGTVTVRATALDGSGVYGEHAIAISGQQEGTATNTATVQGGPTNNTYNSYGLTVEQMNAIVGGAGSGSAETATASSAPSNEELFSIISTIQATMEGQPVQAGVYNLSEEDAAKLTAWLRGEQVPEAAPVNAARGGFPWWVILLAALILAAAAIATALILRSGRRKREREQGIEN